MKLFSLLCLAIASAQELGLIVRCTNPELDEKPIRLFKGQLSVDDGPILQAYFDTNRHFLISDHLIAKDYAGAGIGLTEDKQLIVSATPATDFYARGGWLEHGASAVFYAERDTDGWKLYTSPGDTSMRATPAMLQLADIVFENGDAPEDEMLLAELQVIPSNTTVKPDLSTKGSKLDTKMDTKMDNFGWEKLNKLITDANDDNYDSQDFDDNYDGYYEDYDLDDDLYTAAPKPTVSNNYASQKPYYPQSKNSTTFTASSSGYSVDSRTKSVFTSTHASTHHTKTHASQTKPTTKPDTKPTSTKKNHSSHTQAIKPPHPTHAHHPSPSPSTKAGGPPPKATRLLHDKPKPTSPPRRARPSVITRYVTAFEFHTVFAPVPTVTKTIQVFI